MLRRTWQTWLKKLSGRTEPIREPRRGMNVARRPQVELLEDRTTPSTVISIVPGVDGIGSLDALLASNNGTIAATDGSGAQTISVGALEGFAGSIDITATTDVIFQDLGGTSINFQAGAGQSVSFTAQGQSITFSNAADGLITAGADVRMTANGAAFGATLGGIATNNGSVVLTANNLNIGGAINSGIGTVSIVASTPTLIIGLGGADVAGTQLGLLDTELDRITTASSLIIGGASTVGTITSVGPITQTGSGYSRIDLITQADVTSGGGKVSVSDLTIDAGTGIALSTNASNIAFQNDLNAVSILNDGALTVSTLFATSDNLGTTTALTTVAGPLTIGADLTSVGTITLTAGDSGSPGDFLTILPGVTVRATGVSQDVLLRAGDNIELPAGSSVIANRSISITAGFNDSGDGLGAANISGNLQGGVGSPLTILASQNVLLGNTLSFPGSTVNITSTLGAIVDGNDGFGETNNITAAVVNLSARTGIGSGFNPADPLEITTPVVSAVNSGIGSTGDVRLVNLAGNLSVSGSNAGNGPFSVVARGAGSILTVNATNVTTNVSNANIDLTADDITLTGVVNAGTGIVSLQPFSSTRPIDIGNNSSGATFGLTDAEMDGITASVLRVGNATNTGGIVITGAITTPAGRYSNLNLTTASTITQLTSDTIRGTIGLALQGADGVTLTQTGNAVTTLAGTVLNPGKSFTFFNGGALTIGTVDGVAGVRTNAAAIDIETFPPAGTGPITILNTAAPNDIDSTGGTVTLIGRGAGALFTLAAGAVVRSGGGNMIIQADDLAIGAGAAVTSGVGRTTIQPTTPGTTIDLGTGAGSGTLRIDSAEIAAFTAGTLKIGNATTGNIVVTGAFSAAGTQVLSLQTNGGITENAGGTITAQNLAIRSANAVTMTQANNITSGALAAQVTTGGQGFFFTDANTLTVGVVDGLSGVTTNNAPITLMAANGNLTLNNNVSSGLGAINLIAQGANSLLTNNAAVSNAGANAINLTADRMAIGAGTVTNQAGGNGRVTLAPFTPGRAINLGSSSDTTPGVLELSSAELASVATSGVFQVGVANAGTITLSTSVAVGATTFALINGAPIDGSAGTLQAANLRISSNGPVSLPGNNTIGTVAASVTGAGSFFQLNNVNALTIGNVDGVSGITTNNGSITVTTADGNLTVNNNILAGLGAVQLTAGGANRLLSVNPLQVAGSSAIFTGDRMAIGTGITQINVGTGPNNFVQLQPFSAGRAIDLGAIGDASGTSLNISDAEIDTITAGVIRVGNATAGNITVSNVISEANSATVLHLISGGSIGATGAGRFTASGLSLQGAAGVDLTLNASTVSNLTGSTLTDGAGFGFTNTADLFVNTVDGVVGITTVNGPVNLMVNAAGGQIGVTQAITTGNGDVTLTADDLDLQAAVNAGTGTVILKPKTLSRAITLGSNAVGTMSLLDAELDRVTAGLLRIGAAVDTGNINLAGLISQAGYAILSLITGGAITDATPLPLEGTLIQVSNLSLTAGTGIGSADNLNLDAANLTATNTVSGDIRILNAGPLSISATPIDGVSGVTNVGTGAITLGSANAVTVAAGAVVQSGTAGAGGTITVQSNVGSPNGSANVIFGDGSSVLTHGAIVISADPDGNGIGGAIVFGIGVNLAGPGGTLADTISLTSAGSIALPGMAASVSITVNVTGAGNSILDDGDDTTTLSAPVINLNSQGNIGGAVPITVDDVISALTTPTAAFLGAIDIDLAVNPTLNFTQNGNVQLHGVNAASFNTSQIGAIVPGGIGSQLALIADGSLIANTALTLPTVNDSNLLLGAVTGDVNISAPVMNTGTGPTSLVSAAGSVLFNDTVTASASSNVSVRANGGSIVDGTGAGTVDVIGGPVNLQADVGTIELDVNTTALTATTSNAAITIRGAMGVDLPIANVNAGSSIVDLSVTDGNLTDLNSSDLVADVVGNVVVLTTQGTGQIGSAGAFLEIDASILNASTASQNVWIVDTQGGVGIAQVNVGTATATLQANSGAMFTLVPGGAAEVMAGNLSLIGTNGGSFGNSLSPLDIDAANLTATTGTGQIRLRDTAGGLNVLLAQTNNAPVEIASDGPGAGLTITRVVAGLGNAATLTSTGAIAGVAGGFNDVTAGSLAINAATGIGAPLSAFETAVSTLAANGGTGGVDIVNQGSLTIGTVGILSGVVGTGDVSLRVPESLPASPNDDLILPAGAFVVSIGGNVNLQAGDALSVALGATVQASGSNALAGGFGDDGNGSTITVLGQVTGATVTILGGSGNDAFNINPTASAAVVVVDGQAGTDTISITPNAASGFNVTGGLPNPVGAPPPANLPGDILNVNLGAVTSPQLAATFVNGQGYTGSWTFASGGQPIIFTTIETITPTTSLDVSLTNGTTTSVPGTTTTYTVLVSNLGPSTANGATLTLPLSPSLQNATFTSIATGGATGNTAAGSGSLNEVLTLPAGSTVTYTITALIDPAALGSLTNTATLTAPAISPDLSGAVKTATDTDTLAPSADLAVTTTRVGVAPKPGGPLTYTVTVTNLGVSTSQNVLVNDPLPAGTVVSSITQTAGPTFVLSSPPLGSGGTFTATAASLAPGATATFTLELKAFGVAGTDVSNTVTVSANTADPVAGNNTSTATTAITANTVLTQIVTGTGNGGGPNVRVFDTFGNLIMSFVAFEESFRGGVNVAQGDINGDDFPEIIVGAGVGGAPVVKIFDGATGELLQSYFAYESTFRGGVNVAAGDINGDGVADIIAGSGDGGAPAIKIFDGASGTLLQSYFAYEQTFRGGVNVAAGDVNGDGVVDVIAGSGVGGGPAVRVFSGSNGQLLQSYFAYSETLRDGVRVAAGDVDGDGFADVITGPGNGGTSNIRVFDGRTQAMLSSFFAYDSTVFTGADVATVDLDEDGRADITTGPGTSLPPNVRIFNGTTSDLMLDFLAYDPDFLDGVFVG